MEVALAAPEIHAGSATPIGNATPTAITIALAERFTLVTLIDLSPTQSRPSPVNIKSVVTPTYICTESPQIPNRI